MDDKQLRKSVEKQIKRMKKAQEEHSTLLAQSIFMGTLSLLFVLPVIAGVYLGNWLDDQAEEYSVRWTMSLLFLGLLIGVLNVYLYLREHQ